MVYYVWWSSLTYRGVAQVCLSAIAEFLVLVFSGYIYVRQVKLIPASFWAHVKIVVRYRIVSMVRPRCRDEWPGKYCNKSPSRIWAWSPAENTILGNLIAFCVLRNGALKVQVLENASTEMGSMKLRDSWGWKMQVLQTEYEFVRVEKVSMENVSTSPQRRKTQVRKI